MFVYRKFKISIQISRRLCKQGIYFIFRDLWSLGFRYFLCDDDLFERFLVQWGRKICGYLNVKSFVIFDYFGEVRRGTFDLVWIQFKWLDYWVSGGFEWISRFGYRRDRQGCLIILRSIFFLLQVVIEGEGEELFEFQKYFLEGKMDNEWRKVRWWVSRRSF